MSENRGRQADERDDVARLVRLAGKRRAVPLERAERVRAQARASWRDEVERRAGRRKLWSAAGLAAAALLVLAIGLRFLPTGNGLPAGPASTIRVEALAGRAMARAEASPARRLAAGDGIVPGSELTTDEASRVAIRLASGHSVRLDASTRIRLLDAGSIALERGAVYVDSGLERAGRDPVEVRTPLGVVEEIGTQFELRVLDESLRVRLREGAVRLHHADATHEVRAGNELELGADGSISRREIPAHGSDWAWIVGVTPMLDLEGRTARAFLDWIVRERGWALAFADEDVERAAAETLLGGTVERLTLEQALDAVLPTCRMTYRVEDGVLSVAAVP